MTQAGFEPSAQPSSASSAPSASSANAPAAADASTDAGGGDGGNPQIGIGIKRRFTDAGIHPYDTVEWERREARIPDYVHGGDAFLQPDVEFPVTWSQTATNIVAQKYFRGQLGSPEREWSLRQVIDRIVNTITEWGTDGGYFIDDEEAHTFGAELTYLLLHQRAAFNSPVYFNLGVDGRPAQTSACFILSVDDTIDSILNWYREEGLIFKGGSGAGVNLSTLRSSIEHLSGGGTASGPVSFMRGADASAGTIKSGGTTRRAAKMAILDVDHPDVEEFIWCKAVEERKARVLRDAGFDMGLDGKDVFSVQYQNANNSVRLSDEFMQAVAEDLDWDLKAVTTGEPVRRVTARELMAQIAQAAWECADPGVQYDTTINRWHVIPNAGRINASNPCFPGSSRVHTDKGLVRFDQLVERTSRGETFWVYTHDATNPDAPAECLELTRPEAVMVTGRNEIVRLRFDDGSELRCTPNHRLWTRNRGWVRADELEASDRVPRLDLATPASQADWRIPVLARLAGLAAKTPQVQGKVDFPEKWTVDFAHYLGWLVGDGTVSGNAVAAIYGTAEEQEHMLPRHERITRVMSKGFEYKPARQRNGTVQLRMSRLCTRRFFEALGLRAVKAPDKRVPSSVFTAPTEIQGAFLRGLFDADGCVYDGTKSRYVGLGSASAELLRDVQKLLSTFGIQCRIYSSRKHRAASGFSYTRASGEHVEYPSRPSFDLRISGESIARFAEMVHFDLPSKRRKLQCLVASHRFYRKPAEVQLVGRDDAGVEITYNLSEPRNHSYLVDGRIVSNCSEFMSVDNSACNLASINLLRYLGDDGSFDVDSFAHSVQVLFTAQEILVANSDYPTDTITRNARKHREIGLGYTNLGALLMAQGMPYDSSPGRAWASAVTALMTGTAYATSALIAGRMGAFADFDQNADAALEVMRMHRREAAKIDEELVPPALLSAAQRSWDTTVELAEAFGLRNSQATVLAPTGTISFMLDADTTGIEPEFALVKTKKLVGGGEMRIVNQTVPRALRRLGYGEHLLEQIVEYVEREGRVTDAPGLDPQHYAVFACAIGDHAISPMGHVAMMAAAQPFISGSISKTVNVPESTSVEAIEQLLMDGWRLGLKSVALYRDGSKVGQPLSAPSTDKSALVDAVEQIVEHVIVQQPVRQKLPRERSSRTFSFRVADCHGYVTVGEFEDGRPGEIFLRVAKQGSTLAGMMDAFAISVSHGLQYGVPLEAFVDMFTNMRFEPAGITDDPEIRFASSLVDYIFRRLAVEYLPFERREQLGILTVSERSQPTLPGVEEAVLASEPATDLLHPDDLPPRAQLSSAPPAHEHDVAFREAGSTRGEMVICHVCGDLMQRAGTCWGCPTCGATSGCS